VAVGIMIVHPQKFGEDTVTENQYILINIGDIEVGNIIERPNGNRLSFSITVVQVYLAHLVEVRILEGQHIAGRMVSHRSHKPSVSGSTPDPATKKILNNLIYSKLFFIFVKQTSRDRAAVARKAHNL
jgi:hypothetical protein